MKDIGKTEQGNRIVEMSEDEHREFRRLQYAVEGKANFDFFYSDDRHSRLDFDFASVFSVIHVYYMSRFKVNELQTLLDDIKAALTK
jgi:hypothetical protein